MPKRRVAVPAVLFSIQQRFSPVLKAGVIHNGRKLFELVAILMRHE
jgi:hypothetical protein